ncbi:MAG: Holliday junction resolvase RuvX [Trueperaceae bacterium]
MAKVVLALDVGEARIGLARGEVGAPWAFGRGALRRTGDLARDVAAVGTAAAAEGATRLIVGLPLRAQGGDSAQTTRVRAFADALVAHGLLVELVDERFTTALATRQLRGALTKAKRRDKGRVDEASAVAILETYLAQQATGDGASDAPPEPS